MLNILPILGRIRKENNPMYIPSPAAAQGLMAMMVMVAYTVVFMAVGFVLYRRSRLYYNHNLIPLAVLAAVALIGFTSDVPMPRLLLLFMLAVVGFLMGLEFLAPLLFHPDGFRPRGGAVKPLAIAAVAMIVSLVIGVYVPTGGDLVVLLTTGAVIIGMKWNVRFPRNRSPMDKALSSPLFWAVVALWAVTYVVNSIAHGDYVGPLMSYALFVFGAWTVVVSALVFDEKEVRESEWAHGAFSDPSDTAP